ncbi:MAG: Trk system potassium transporter TrkA [Firmicutes bacterium]|nr:Trk system potassium transporter TrkA [Bacillota bacterium]
MKAIIIGAGKVGYSLASVLSKEGHEVTVVDANRRRLDMLAEHLDINVVEGNAAQLDTLINAGVENAGLFAATTEKDELNMVACFMAKQAGAASTVARVRNPGYSDFDDAARLEALGIDMIINPERVTAEEIYKLINHPEAHYVGYFGGGTVQVVEVRIPIVCDKQNVPLMDLTFPCPGLIIAIEREGELIIPRGQAVLQAGDEVLLIANTKNMRALESYLGVNSSKVSSVAIMGGGFAGYYLASMLEQRHKKLQIKLIEEDFARCEEMAQSLKETVIINNSGFSLQLFEDENIAAVDIFVALTEDDKENLFSCVLAKSLGAKKTIAQIRGGDFINIIEKTGIDKAISPRNLTADGILRFINRRHILSLTRFEGHSGQITELLIPEHAVCAGKTLMDLEIPEQAIVCMIIRGSEHIIPQGKDMLQSGDQVILFALPEALDEAEELLTAVR